MEIFGFPIEIVAFVVSAFVVYLFVMLKLRHSKSDTTIEKQTIVEHRTVEKINIKWQYVFSLFLLLLSQVVYFGGISVKMNTLGGALVLSILALIVFIYGVISETLEGLGEEEWFEGG